MKTFFMTFIIATVVLVGANKVFVDEPVYKNHIVTVSKGDTLWDIAAQHSAPGEDVREVIYRISRSNNLTDKTLYPGQQLNIPVQVEVHEEIMLAAKE